MWLKSARTYIVISIVLATLLLGLRLPMAASGSAVASEGTPIYHAGDMAKINAFLLQTQDEVTNAQLLGWGIDEPETWEGALWVGNVPRRLSSFNVSATGVHGMLDLSGCTELTGIYCSSNRITAINVTGVAKLDWLDFDNNQLTSIDLSTNTAMQGLSCSGNRLTSLDVSANKVLQYFYCNGNQLSKLNISANSELLALRCDNNKLTSLNLSANKNLLSLDCFSNQLPKLDISANTELTSLICDDNPISKLDISANKSLETLYCRNTGISSAADIQGWDKFFTTIFIDNTPLLASSVEIKGNPKILRVELLEKERSMELSKDKNNPTGISYYNYLSVIGNEECAAKHIDCEYVINGKKSNIGIVMEFDANATFSYRDNYNYYVKGKEDVIAFQYIFVENFTRKVISESPVYYVYFMDEEESRFNLADSQVLEAIVLTESQLVMQVKSDYLIFGDNSQYWQRGASNAITLKDKTSGHEYQLEILLANGLVKGVYTNKIVYNGLHLNKDHQYEITVPRGMVANSSSPLTNDYQYSDECTVTVRVSSFSFKDVPSDSWPYVYIHEFMKYGVLNGYEDGTFRPDKTVSRREFAKMLAEVLQLPLAEGVTPTFADVLPNSWEYPYVEAVKLYFTSYTDGEKLLFKGGEPAVREDVAVTLVKVLGLQDQQVDLAELKQLFLDHQKISANLQKYVLIAYKNGLMTGYADKTFAPQKTITRAEAVTLLLRALSSLSEQANKTYEKIIL